jgi:hypothetical protein
LALPEAGSGRHDATFAATSPPPPFSYRLFITVELSIKLLFRDFRDNQCYPIIVSPLRTYGLLEIASWLKGGRIVERQSRIEV